ncbi:MAG TPA: sigma-70 family RNA polymerase sigma factor [Polyangiales bacterium]
MGETSLTPTAMLAAPARTSARAVVRRAMPEGISDGQLLAALRRGEAWATGQLYARLQEPVSRTLARFLRRQGGQLEDLVQTSFERMIRFLTHHTLDEDCNLRGWARTVATNVALDHLRREVSERRLFVSAELQLETRHGVSAESALDARASLHKLQRALAGMDRSYAQTVLLHDVLGHELREIALQMHVSVAAAQSRLVRGRKELLKRTAKLRP